MRPSVPCRAAGAITGVAVGLSALGACVLVLLTVGAISFAGTQPDSFTILIGMACCIAVAGSAALSGSAFATAARLRRSWTGMAMGFATYWLAALIFVAVVMTSQGPLDPGVILNAPVAAIVGGALLAPLLVVCMLAGAIWSTIMRILWTTPASGTVANGSYSIRWILAGTVTTHMLGILLWLTLLSLASSMQGIGNFD